MRLVSIGQHGHEGIIPGVVGSVEGRPPGQVQPRVGGEHHGSRAKHAGGNVHDHHGRSVMWRFAAWMDRAGRGRDPTSFVTTIHGRLDCQCVEGGVVPNGLRISNPYQEKEAKDLVRVQTKKERKKQTNKN